MFAGIHGAGEEIRQAFPLPSPPHPVKVLDEAADRMTDRQIAAKVRKHFAEKDSTAGSR